MSNTAEHQSTQMRWFYLQQPQRLRVHWLQANAGGHKLTGEALLIQAH